MQLNDSWILPYCNEQLLIYMSKHDLRVKTSIFKNEDTFISWRCSNNPIQLQYFKARKPVRDNEGKVLLISYNELHNFISENPDINRLYSLPTPFSDLYEKFCCQEKIRLPQFYILQHIYLVLSTWRTRSRLQEQPNDTYIWRGTELFLRSLEKEVIMLPLSTHDYIQDFQKWFGERSIIKWQTRHTFKTTQFSIKHWATILL